MSKTSVTISDIINKIPLSVMALITILLPDFQFMEEHSLTEGMAVFTPIYKLLDRLPAARNISNKIIVLEKEL